MIKTQRTRTKTKEHIANLVRRRTAAEGCSRWVRLCNPVVQCTVHCRLPACHCRPTSAMSRRSCTATATPARRGCAHDLWDHAPMPADRETSSHIPSNTLTNALSIIPRIHLKSQLNVILKLSNTWPKSCLKLYTFELELFWWWTTARFYRPQV